MERARQIIHLVPRDATLFRVLEIETQVLSVFNRLFQLEPNLPLFARGMSSARDSQATERLGAEQRVHLLHKSQEALVRNVKRFAERRKHLLFQFGSTMSGTRAGTHESVSPRRSLRRTLRSDSCLLFAGSKDVDSKRD